MNAKDRRKKEGLLLGKILIGQKDDWRRAMMIDNMIMKSVKNGYVLVAIKAIYETKGTVDLVLLRDQLKGITLLDLIGGVDHLVSLAECALDANGIDEIVQELKDDGMMSVQ